MEAKMIVSPAPHLHDRTSVSYVMWNVVISFNASFGCCSNIFWN